MNLKIGVQRVGLDLGQRSLGVAYRARVTWIEHWIELRRQIMNAHLLSFRAAPNTVQC
jgi:hypothetical protein